MEVKYWDGGLTEHEVSAIEKMKNAFQEKNQSQIKGKGFNTLKNIHSIFPWKGYAGFRLVGKNGQEGEFDLVIITHCNVLVVELKDWNGGLITNQNLHWYNGNADRGISPVKITRDKTFLLKEKLEKFKGKFANSNEKFPTPAIEFLVVMTGDSDFSSLSEEEKAHVISLDDFLKLADNQLFSQQFGQYTRHPNARTLNRNFSIFDQIFGGNRVAPKPINKQGYYAESKPIFEHPKKIYQEYLAQTKDNKNQDQALLRRWDFSKINKPEAQTSDGRYRLVSREYDILQCIKNQNADLYRSCLNCKSTPQKEEITAQYIDLFEIFPQQKRFNQFIGGVNGENLTTERRLGLVQILLSKFTELHKIGIAHRDLGDHSIWLAANDSITLSGFATAHFATAHFQSEQTMGDIRQILEVSGDLAKDHFFPISSNLKPTPYQYDVRALAVVAWHIIYGKRISPDSLNEMKEQLSGDTQWYADILRTALSDKPFKDAGEFLECFNREKPEQAVDFAFDWTQLEPFNRDINYSRQYREDDDFIIETSEKEVYRSNGYLVKAWISTDPQRDEQKARVVFNWLNQVAKLSSLSPDYLPKIHDFGIAKKSSCLFMVSDFIDGDTWKNTCQNNQLSDEQKQSIIHQLVSSIEHLHSLGLTHGDLKPDNVLLTFDEDNIQLHILDIFDFSPTGETLFNTAYSPEFDDATEKQRDNFAVMKMAYELWQSDEIDEAINWEYQDNQTAFISLDRFKEVFTPKAKTPMVDITIGWREPFPPISIYPENGELFVQFKSSEKHPNQVIDITFIGLGGKFTAFYIIDEQKFRRALKPSEKDYITRKERDNSNLSLSVGFNIKHTQHSSNLSTLDDFIKNNEVFQNAIKQFIAENSFRLPETNGVQIFDEQIDETVITVTDEITDSERPKIQDLWQAILDTETEALPYIKANDEPKHTENKEVYIVYDGEIDPLDQFRQDDIVEAIGIREDGEKTVKYGTVDLSKSQLNKIHLKNHNHNTYSIKTNTTIYFQSKLSKASFIRRKNALQRILNKESVIKNLLDYFDENCTLLAENYHIEVTDEQFSRYDQPEKNIRLNDAQRIAFQRLIDNGPLSLLQGPPGTGKTEFIAAFVHYLFDVQKVRNILLVSQSHEAVNTAAERIRKHCRRLGTDLQLVRFSNREVADSEILEDIFSPNLVGQKRQQLNVNKIDNICSLGRTMGLPEKYLRERAEIIFGIGREIRRYQKIVHSDHSDKDVDEDEKNLQTKLKKNILKQSLQMKLDKILEIDEILPQLIDNLDKQYNIQPKESEQAGKLIDLTQDMLEALSNDRCNYDEFLARSRQLVIGTCVGIGQRHIGIAENVYDWVIIDEAARSISSELAIAMQSGTRILLVGDHKQLPPLYSDEHKSALARRLGIHERGEELEYALGCDFERVFESQYGKHTCASLTTQYRMAPAIGNLISACFYQNELKNGKKDSDVPNIYFRLPEKIQSTVTWLDVASLPNAYHEQEGNSFLNRAEAKVIIELLQDLANDDTFMNSNTIKECLGNNTPAVGVICMYAAQKNLIRKMFQESSVYQNEDFCRLVKIDSVDSYQGKENRMIILSLTRHDKQYSTGFLHLPNRINVALSRAMDKLIIVGAKAVWEHPNNRKTSLAKVLHFIQQEQQDNPQHYAVKILKNIGAKK